MLITKEVLHKETISVNNIDNTDCGFTCGYLRRLNTGYYYCDYGNIPLYSTIRKGELFQMRCLECINDFGVKND